MDIKNWLEKRIATTEKERQEADSPQVIIGKGAKLTTYKEVLEFINAHEEIEE